MRDPIEELENFNQQGLHVNPLSASEVRRRGDRMRRRNTALATVGAVAAAVIVIATPLAVVANRDSKSAEPMPVPPGPSQTVERTWLQKIPAGFDLEQGLNGDDEANPPTQAPKSGVDDITLCGVPAWSATAGDPVAAPVDVLGATYALPGSENSANRTLALYADDNTAQAALDAIRGAVATCPRDPNGAGAPLLHRAEDLPLPADDSFVFSERAQIDADLLADLTVVQAARVGNALYLATSHGSAAEDQVVDFEVQRMAGLSAPVLSEMTKVFAPE